MPPKKREPANPDEALAKLKIMDETGGAQDLRLLVSKKHVGAVIGREGANVVRLRAETGAFISVLWGKSQQRVVALKGSTPQLVNAVDAILDLIEEGDATSGGGNEGGSISNSNSNHGAGNGGSPQHKGAREVQILCHTSQVGCIIGKGGALVKDALVRTGARITLSTHPLPNSTEKLVVISGNGECVSKAVHWVLSQLHDHPVKAGVSTVPFDPSTSPTSATGAASTALPVSPQLRHLLPTSNHHSMAPSSASASTISSSLLSPLPISLPFSQSYGANKHLPRGGGAMFPLPLQHQQQHLLHQQQHLALSHPHTLSLVQAHPQSQHTHSTLQSQVVSSVQNHVRAGGHTVYPLSEADRAPLAFCIKVAVPVEAVPGLIGKGGVVIRSIHHSSRASISIADATTAATVTTTTTVTTGATSTGAISAKSTATANQDRDKDNNKEREIITTDKEKESSAGSGSSPHSTSSTISSSNSSGGGSGCRVATIIGSEQAVRTAVALIKARVDHCLFSLRSSSASATSTSSSSSSSNANIGSTATVANSITLTSSST